MIYWFVPMILAFLAVDLFAFNRHGGEVSVRKALLLSLFWFALAMGFNLYVAKSRGSEVAMQFFAGYLIELSLSVDNLFVFLMLFAFFKVERRHQHHLLFWGILGALVCRGAFIFLGTAMVSRFEWLLWGFGAFLVYTGIKMALPGGEEEDPESSALLRLGRKYLPIAEGPHHGRILTKQDGRWMGTSLLLVLVMVEGTDLLFAVDSIPAVFAVSTDPFIVYTSNVFAILGLRSMYFALAGMMGMFRFLKYGLAVILTFVGVKLLLGIWHVHVAIGLTLAVIGVTLAVAVGLSVLLPEPKTEEPQ